MIDSIIAFFGLDSAPLSIQYMFTFGFFFMVCNFILDLLRLLLYHCDRR